MKKFKFSLLYILILLLTLPFHVQIKNLLVNCKGFDFITYKVGDKNFKFPLENSYS